jgi:hypothetical protein
MESLPTAESFDRYLLAFGEDHDGELYVATDGDTSPGGDSGQLAKLVAEDGRGSDSDDGTDGDTDDGPTTAGTSTAGDATTTADDSTTDVDGTTPDADATIDDDGTTDAPADSTPGFGVLATFLAGVGALAERRRRQR